uniref:Uncharacterized protein n=1 Tax=Anguilla anguilla TaxID=7936 RepID=A0A0E9SG94_ANGAN
MLISFAFWYTGMVKQDYVKQVRQSRIMLNRSDRASSVCYENLGTFTLVKLTTSA